MPQRLQKIPVISALLLSLFLVLLPPAWAALPPTIDAHPLFGDTFVSGRWQPIVVTIASADSGEALTGEIKTSLGEMGTGDAFGAWTVPVTLPHGAGTTRTTVTVFVPEHEQPNLSVSLQQGRDGKGATLTRHNFDKLRFVDPSLTLLAVTSAPDALSYLRGEKLGVENETGVLRPAPDTAPSASQKKPYQQQGVATADEIRVETVAEAGLLPSTATGYDTIGIVYLGSDIGPNQFSDAQVSALRGWVVGGGLLVVGSRSLRADERFRTWIPVALPSGLVSISIMKSRIGRGMVASTQDDPTEASFGKSQAALRFWRKLLSDACSEPLLGNLVQGRGLRDYYSPMQFWQTVIRAPGLKAPPSGAIALFLFAYLLLLVPVNYLILKRLDKREWTWATVPILVTLFSVGAYFFGYAVKGTRMLQNTITLVEMGANRGESVVTASVGVFSPRQARYDLSTPLRDTAFWTPQNGYGANSGEYGPMETATPGETGGDSAVHVRNADISMWAMRVFAARTYQVKMGNGVTASLVQNGTQIAGIVRNDTGRTLENASVSFAGARLNLGTMEPGAQKSVRLMVPSGGRNNRRDSRIDLMSGGPASEFKQPVLQSLNQALNTVSQNQAMFYAWNQDEVFPVKIDGQAVPVGTNLNLIAVAIPVEKMRSK